MIFKSDRTFSHRNPDTGLMECFFNAREGIYGPYLSKEEASLCLKEFLAHCIKFADDGGRKNHEQRQFSLIQKKYTAPKVIIGGKFPVIETFDNSILMETVGVAMAIDKLRESLDRVESHLDDSAFEKASHAGYQEVAYNFVYVQRTLAGL